MYGNHKLGFLEKLPPLASFGQWLVVLPDECYQCKNENDLSSSIPEDKLSRKACSGIYQGEWDRGGIQKNLPLQNRCTYSYFVGG
jgi:hypothetical protein